MFAVLLTGAGPAYAHTAFKSSSPAHESTLDAPVEVVTVVFTGPVMPLEDGFVALTAAGQTQLPVSVETVDNVEFALRFDPALSGGPTGVRWSVQSPDSHVIEGAFSFTVNAPVPTTGAPATTVPPTTTTPTTVAASTNSAATTVPTTPVTTVAPTTSVAAAPVADSGRGGGQSLDEFLAVDGSRPGETTALVGRILEFLGVAIALGFVAFAVSTMRGSAVEIRTLLVGAAGLAGLLVLGAVVEYTGVAQVGDESVGSAWSTSAGFATVLRLVGGLALAAGLAGTIRRNDYRPATAGAAPRPLSAAVRSDVAMAERTVVSTDVLRWVPTRRDWPIAVGAVAALASFWFDGHTVSHGFRPLHAAVDTVHVAAGSVWVGGVLALCGVAWSRSRAARATGAGELLVRFSTSASIALAAVAAAGTVMAFIVLDSFGDLTGTDWGQTLLIKMAAVAVAAGIGVYNHFRLVPALEAEPESALLSARLRSTITAEATALVVVVVVTAWLVAAATT